jgi:NAD(P)H-dependent flavin oxidoreductase YrpB (nitropropane dioxygenase family)
LAEAQNTAQADADGVVESAAAAAACPSTAEDGAEGLDSGMLLFGSPDEFIDKAQALLQQHATPKALSEPHTHTAHRAGETPYARVCCGAATAVGHAGEKAAHALTDREFGAWHRLLATII